MVLDIIILIIALITTALTLLQDDKNDGVMSLSGSNNIALFEKNKTRGGQKYLEIATWILTIALFVLIGIKMVTQL